MGSFCGLVDLSLKIINFRSYFIAFMFIEPNLSGERRGWIEVICGSMFSGKTEELIRRLKRVRIANQKAEIFKPAMDIRFDIRNIISHDENAVVSTPIDNSQTI